ncbi:hypothetical protein ACHAXM_007021 [Skeletonema potamos]
MIRPSLTSLFLSQDDDDDDGGTEEEKHDRIMDTDDGRGGGRDDAIGPDNNSDDKSNTNMPQTKNNSNNNNNNKGNNESSKKSSSILQLINPFNAGKSLRSTVESAFDLASAIASTKDQSSLTASRLPPDRRAIYYNYYVDDSLGLSSSSGGGGGSLELKDDGSTILSSSTTTLSSTPSSSSSVATTTTTSSLPSTTTITTSSSWLEEQDKDYRPEVLIVGATGELGRVIVKRLILENKVRVRVLVRDLYSNTLNKLGVGVTYCQGELGNMESLEYAVTDVDKIIFCAGNNNNNKKKNGGSNSSRKNRRHDNNTKGEGGGGGEEENEKQEGIWDNLESILNQRKQSAELVDGIGLRNLLHAYLNVRHSDYGPSQAAKRTLFKFRKRPADFGLFGIDGDDVIIKDSSSSEEAVNKEFSSSSSSSSVVASLSQCEWTKNKFGHGVFTGKVGRYGEAALASARLRSRNDPEQGIDLSVGGFAGLVCRICSDGGVYEAFVRTEAFERLGVEYVCEFKTASKTPKRDSENRSRDKFSTVRLEFKDFLPRMRPQFQTKEDEEDSREALVKSGNIPKFVGKDIRQIGFRFRGQSNPLSWSSGFSRFYLALDFIKVYRGQPEPEFIYLSDSRIPPVVNDGMVKHDIKRLITNPMESDDDVIRIIDENEAQRLRDKKDRSAEETYFKYMGEEMIKQSGLSYTIIRVAGYNERQPGTDSSTVRLQKMNKNIVPVSRADLALVVASAILEPNACNLVLYMTKSQTRGVKDGYLWEKFARLKEKTK